MGSAVRGEAEEPGRPAAGDVRPDRLAQSMSTASQSFGPELCCRKSGVEIPARIRGSDVTPMALALFPDVTKPDGYVKHGPGRQMIKVSQQLRAETLKRSRRDRPYDSPQAFLGIQPRRVVYTRRTRSEIPPTMVGKTHPSELTGCRRTERREFHTWRTRRAGPPGPTPTMFRPEKELE